MRIPLIGQPTALGQATPAQSLFLAQVSTPFGGGGTRRRKSRAVARPARKTRKRASSKRPARLVKGSAAAKRYMASIRRKRRR